MPAHWEPNQRLSAETIGKQPTRRIQGGTADTVIKLRPVVPEELPKELRKTNSMKVVPEEDLSDSLVATGKELGLISF